MSYVFSYWRQELTKKVDAKIWWSWQKLVKAVNIYCYVLAYMTRILQLWVDHRMISSFMNTLGKTNHQQRKSKVKQESLSVWG